MDTLEVGTLLVDDSDSSASATSSPVLFFAFVGVTAEESEICPKHWKITTKKPDPVDIIHIYGLAFLKIYKVKQTLREICMEWRTEKGTTLGCHLSWQSLIRKWEIETNI
jgi:hypothetical protein